MDEFLKSIKKFEDLQYVNGAVIYRKCRLTPAIVAQYDVLIEDISNFADDLSR
jgi:hypothetical protein